jgi:CRP-like cAMP-binding protein
MSDLALTGVADIGVARRRRATDLGGLLAGIALFRGIGDEDLGDMMGAFEHQELQPGEILWRQTAPSDGLYVLLEGNVQVCRRLPGERELELARLGAGEVLGELPLLGGGPRTATVRALGTCSLLYLSRAEFEARTMSGCSSALELRRRIVAIACARLRRGLAAFAGAVDGAGRRGGAARSEGTRAEPVKDEPPMAYLSRLPVFEALEPDLLTELLASGTLRAVPQGHVIQRVGSQPGACYITLRGAVEDVLRRGDPRVGFAGPGRAFGYLGLLDGEPAPVTSVARERSLILAIDGDDFARLVRSPGARSRAFAAAIEMDLIRSLDLEERARARLAAGASA